MATFKPDAALVGNTLASGVAVLGPNEAKVHCPRCRSPAIVVFEPGEPKYGDTAVIVIEDVRLLHDAITGKPIPFTREVKRAIPGFACAAGDCGYKGPAGRD